MVTLSGGDALKKAMDELAQKVTNAAVVSVGFLSDAKYPDNKTHVAMVAALNEFGHGKTPPRPFFRSMIQKNSGEWPELISDALTRNKFDAKKTLAQTGEVIRVQLQQSISDFSGPALSPVTVMLRGMRSQARYRDMPFWERFAIAKQRVADGKTNYGASETPLIDTNVMRNSAAYRVE